MLHRSHLYPASGTGRTVAGQRRAYLHLRSSRSRQKSYPDNKINNPSVPSTNESASTSGRLKVLQLLGEGHGTYSAEHFKQAVAQLIAENPTPQPGNESLALGQGTWQVFYAPHIARLSSALGTRFQPIQYRLSGSSLVSNVKYSNPLLGEGWLSAGGTMIRKYDDAVEVTFDRFWVDLGADSLRADLPPGTSTAMLTTDGLIATLGRAAFFPQLAVFPVLYLDSDLAVFKFTPLDSPIAVHRVA